MTSFVRRWLLRLNLSVLTVKHAGTFPLCIGPGYDTRHVETVMSTYGIRCGGPPRMASLTYPLGGTG